MIRVVRSRDQICLAEMEKAASTKALDHVFPAEIPFPYDDVLARWALLLDDRSVTVLVDEFDGSPVGYAAVADSWLRHFGLVPAHWGTGRAQVLHEAVLGVLAAQGAATAYLWVLVDNHRARAFYRRAGWKELDVREAEVFPPYPMKMQMRRPL